MKINYFHFQALASDSDSAQNGELSYYTNRLHGDRAIFNIDKTTAELTTATVITREKSDGGYTLFHSTTINATDNGKPPLSGLCYLKVQVTDKNNQVPFFLSKSYDTFITPSDSRVIRVFAFDRDSGANARVTYSLAQDSNCANCFAIDRTTGVITRQTTLSAVSAY